MNRGHEIGLLHERPFREDGELIDPPGAQLPAWCWSGRPPADVLAPVAQWGPELVYSQGLENGELEAALFDNYPVVLYAHNYIGTCLSGRKCHSFPTARACARRFGPGCLVLYYPRRCGGLNPSTMLRMYRRQSQVNSTLCRCLEVLVASRHMANEFENHGVRPEQIHVVPLPAAAGTPSSAAPVAKTPQGRILFIGRLTDIKGGDQLVRALALSSTRLGRPLTLTVAGDGPELPKMQGLANSLGVSMRCAGWVGDADKLELIRDTDLLAVPSVWPEPFGLVGVEAGSQGVPTAGYASGGIPEWLIPGVTGELASATPPTVDGLADAIVRALADPFHYQKLCRGAWEMARQFTLEQHLTLLLPILARHATGVCAEELSGPCSSE
jgi:glycosyltransferase involved in cell wall biosynthesis